jgi:hypothetical protein
MALCNLKVAPVLGSKGDVYDELKLFLGDYVKLFNWYPGSMIPGSLGQTLAKILLVYVII